MCKVLYCKDNKELKHYTSISINTDDVVHQVGYIRLLYLCKLIMDTN